MKKTHTPLKIFFLLKAKTQLKISVGILLLLFLLPQVEKIYYLSKAKVAQHLLQSAWQQTQQLATSENAVTKTNNQAGNLPHKITPWPWADTSPALKLNFLQHEFIVLENATGESLAFAPGLVTQQIQPGDIGNSLIAAHRDTHFKNLKTVKLNDVITTENKQGQITQFIVDQIIIVNADNEKPIVDIDHARLTLITCYPFTSNFTDTPLRYLVSAKRPSKKA